MKFEEKIAKEYFEFKKYRNIEFEPIGNTPPDFLLNKKVAVEVRRLNKFHLGIPLEKIDYNVIPKIEKLIYSYGKDVEFENTTIVHLYYSRPINYSNLLARKIENILGQYLKKKQSSKIFIVSANLEIDFYQLNEKWDTPFEVGGIVDYDRGGLVFNDVLNSLKYIIKEKFINSKNFIIIGG